MLLLLAVARKLAGAAVPPPPIIVEPLPMTRELPNNGACSGLI
jgi:hypothetical protein